MPHVLVATPGRLLDLVDEGLLSLGEVVCVVLDEADKMLSLGFKPQLDRLLNLLIKQTKGVPC
jgi:superfamily II DNA/RNA helicase